jgi:hypothetical protein
MTSPSFSTLNIPQYIKEKKPTRPAISFIKRDTRCCLHWIVSLWTPISHLTKIRKLLTTLHSWGSHLKTHRNELLNLNMIISWLMLHQLTLIRKLLNWEKEAQKKRLDLARCIWNLLGLLISLILFTKMIWKF